MNEKNILNYLNLCSVLFNIQTYVHRWDLIFHAFLNLLLFAEYYNVTFPLCDYKYYENTMLNCYLLFQHVNILQFIKIFYYGLQFWQFSNFRIINNNSVNIFVEKRSLCISASVFWNRWTVELPSLSSLKVKSTPPPQKKPFLFSSGILTFIVIEFGL